MRSSWLAPRGALLLIGIWLAGAAVAISVGFFAVGRVGRDLNGQAADSVTGGELRASAQRLARAAPPTGATEGATGGEPAVQPTSTPAPVAATSEVTTTTAPAASPVSARFDTAGGVVAATCAGSRISLQFAYPANGYTAHVERDPSHIEAEFKSPSREVHLTVRCVDGRPVTDEPGYGSDDDQPSR